MPGEKQTVDFFSVRDEFLFTSDTIPTKQNSESGDTLLKKEAGKDTLTQEDTTSNQKTDSNQLKIDSILRISEERTRQIEIQSQKEKEIQQKRIYKPHIDTVKILSREFGITNFPVKERLENDPLNRDLFLHFKSVKPEQKRAKKPVFIEESSPVTTTHSETTPKKDVKPLPAAIKAQFDWITILLVVSFILFGWIRLFHKKYLLSLFKSVISFREAHSLYRDKNSMMQRASFLGNLLFVSNMSLFVVQLSKYFNFQIADVAEYELYLFVFAGLTGLYIFRAITSGFIGVVFLKQQVFAEYFHHVNVYTKNIGLSLFPVVVALQFITHEYLDFMIYIGLGLVLLFYVLQLLRSFQIINRKNVSIFYMILYLCAFEFAPFLILYKIYLSL